MKRLKQKYLETVNNFHKWVYYKTLDAFQKKYHTDKSLLIDHLLMLDKWYLVETQDYKPVTLDILYKYSHEELIALHKKYIVALKEDVGGLD